MAGTRWHVLSGPQDVARTVLERTLEVAREAIAARGVFRLVLAGGSTPERMYRMLAEQDADWGSWRTYIGDERCLPESHDERNSVMVRRAWLDRIPNTLRGFAPIAAELGAEPAAQAYAAIVRDAVPFDLVHLGMGEDGHTASLFPGHAHEGDAWVRPVFDAPKPPSDRVTLSERALNDARGVYIIVTGEAKRDAVRAWRAGEGLPVARIHGHSGAEVFLDEAAAS